MSLLESLVVGLPVFVVLLGPLMFVHELGHFIVAKWAGIRVEEFGLGIPPRMARLFQRGETEYTLNWLPIGAFVRMTGEEDPSDPRSFAAQPKRWRFAVLFAGPFMNFVFGLVVLFVAHFAFATQPTAFHYYVLSVQPGGVAAALGVQPGDEILAVNGEPFKQPIDASHAFSASALREAVLRSAGKTLTLEVERVVDGQPQRVVLRGTVPQQLNSEAPLGVSVAFRVVASERRAYTIGEAAQAALEDFVSVWINLVRLPAELISQRMPLEQIRPVGPVGITNIGVAMLEERETQGLFPFVRFAGLISVLLGLTNLLPLPALDGGRIVFVLIEAVRGRRVDPARERWVHGVGMAFLISLSLAILILDIVAPIDVR
ncbi:MAG: M50 family metallopeptidase [Anaerolineae bacterium]|nr:M50 family metallopeptidase [Thermoflexales bacterium]MDW8053994.1 M50 family metallopeptidase [Anaerolineae bacterium]